MSIEHDKESHESSLLQRWAERKAHVAEEEQPPTPVVAPFSELQEEPEPTLLPPLESLDENSDYRGFLAPEVSEELHRLALRKLFHSSRFQVLDGLNDYDEDYTSFAPLGDLITHEMRRKMEAEAKRLAENEAADSTEQEASSVTEKSIEDEPKQEMSQERSEVIEPTDEDNEQPV